MELVLLNQIAKASVSSETKTTITQHKHSFYRQARKLGQPQRWRLKLSTVPLEVSTAMAMFAQINQLDGQFERAKLKNPIPPLGTAITVKSLETSMTGSENVRVKVFTQKLGDAFKAGDFVQFNGHTKVYQVVAFDTSTQTLKVYPKLKSTVAANEAVLVGDAVTFLVYSDEANTELAITAAKPVSLELELVEVTQ